MDEVKFSVTNAGEMSGLPPTGRPVEFRLLTKFHSERGKICEHSVYFDQQDFTEQLGLTFPAILIQLPKLALRILRMSALMG